DLVTGERRAHAGLKGVVSMVGFMPDGRSVIATSSAGDARLFEEPRAGAILTDHRAEGVGLAVSKDGRIASIDVKGTLRITEPGGGTVAEHTLALSAETQLKASPDGLRFAGVPFLKLKAHLPAEQKDGGKLFLGTFDATKPVMLTLPAQINDLAWQSDGAYLL